MDKAEITPTSGGGLEVTASTPTQAAECQRSVIEWMRNKMAFVRTEAEALKAEADEMEQAFNMAKAKKWNTISPKNVWDTGLKRWRQGMERLAYYEKLLAALEAGFFIVPPMDMTVFAIRTDSKKPAHYRKYLQVSAQGNFEQDKKVLPAGSGDYKNPQPLIRGDYSKDWKDETTGIVKLPFWADAWESVEFPITMLKPKIMEATDRAMALKIFDEIGVLPQDFRRNPDPVIMGRIYEPKRHQTYTPKVITFMIAWHLNTKDL